MVLGFSPWGMMSAPVSTVVTAGALTDNAGGTTPSRYILYLFAPADAVQVRITWTGVLSDPTAVRPVGVGGAVSCVVAQTWLDLGDSTPAALYPETV